MLSTRVDINRLYSGLTEINYPCESKVKQDYIDLHNHIKELSERQKTS